MLKWGWSLTWTLVRPDAAKALEEPGVKKALARYVDVVKHKRYAKFLIARKLEADYDEEGSTSELWKVHDKLVNEYYKLEREIDLGRLNFDELPSPEKSFLSLKILLGARILRSCRLCERNCGVDRYVSNEGYCKAPADMPVSSYFEHLGEEPEIVPSFTVYS